MGNLLGTTGAGGSLCRHSKTYGCGTIFRIIPNGLASQESVIYAFCSLKDCKDGFEPGDGVLLDSSGNLFGTTNWGGGNDIDQNGLGGGVAYKISGPSLTVLHHFCALANCADGEYPDGALIFDASGTVVGSTARGGAFGGGAIFELKP